MRNRTVSRRGVRLVPVILAVCAAALIVGDAVRLKGQSTSTGWKIVAWNNLGMHCMDADFSVFSILPPYNTIQAQLIDPSGTLVKTPAGITVTYQGVADPTGSINTTSVGKTNFWTFVATLFGAALPADTGLLNHNMPGQGNYPQSMIWDQNLNWFIAEGIPITPYDDGGKKNYYPLMNVAATDATGALLASTNIVLPVSDEMDCRACHASGSGPAAQPKAGWVNVTDPQHDYRLNILRLHDDRQLGTAVYASALAAKRYSSNGLYPTATAGTAILCAACHKSEALAGSGITGIPPLTASIHSLHSTSKVVDPTNGLTLEASANRSACYRCHPGSETRCLRGAMGKAVAPDGTMAMQCQSCHGSMSAVGASTRTGWLNEPTCQNCHTGTAVQNSGAIRFTSAFDSAGKPRTPANTTFATQDGAPAAGLNLYRFSAGHGGLQCSACHGSTHAEYPSSHPNDNLQSTAMQGHIGPLSECTTCHGTSPTTVNGGPHGMHPVGSPWLSAHQSAAYGNQAQCQACHGSDYRGTVLSRTFAARTFSVFGGKNFFKGSQIGCYTCHNGPSNDSGNTNRAPVASNVTTSTSPGVAVTIPLVATDADGNTLTLRIVSQPANGSVGLTGTTATYYPFAGSSGTDTFTYAAWDGSIDSNLATVTINVGGASPCSVSAAASVPSTASAGVSVPFSGSATATSCTGSVTYDWNFGDGSGHMATASTTHTYSSAGTFTWAFTATAGGVASVRTGSITVGAGCSVTASATVPGSGTIGVPVSFSGTASASNCGTSVAYDWNFGDGSGHAATASATHTYSSAGMFTWTFTATAGAVKSVRTGSITVKAAAPSIRSVSELDSPFRVQIDGANFQQGAKVYIGPSTTPWASTQLISSSQLMLSGGGLRSQFPRGATVQIRVVNPDGQSDSAAFTRK